MLLLLFFKVTKELDTIPKVSTLTFGMEEMGVEQCLQLSFQPLRI